MDNLISAYNSTMQSIIDSSNGVVDGVLSGFDEYDKFTNGFQNSELIVIGGRPSMGKTSLAVSLSINIGANNNKEIGVISLQIPVNRFIRRMISQETGYSAIKLRKGKIEEYEWERLYVCTKNIKEAPIFIQHSSCMNINQIITCCKDMVHKHQVKCILIDKLQLVEPLPFEYKFSNREQEINKVVIKLKQTALELNIPIILFSDLNRSLEGRGGSKRPILSDLRGSGQIENIADVVAFLFRPEYYKIAEWDDEERTPTQGKAELCIKLHNEGQLNNIRLSFNTNTGKFNNLIKEPFEFVSKIDYDDPFLSTETKQKNTFGGNFNSQEDNNIPF